VLSGIYRTIVSQILIFVILGLFIWFLVGSAVSKITEPIESLTSSMSQVAEGDYQVEVQVIPRNDEIGVLSKAFAHLVDSVRDYSEKLRELSIHDALTGLFNNREFETRFDKEWERSVRYTVPLSFFMSDIDFFKNFNDDFGHQVGDEVLKSVARVFQENIRTSDTAFRYGGEEFCVMLPETNLEKARVVAEKLRRKVEELPACMAEGKETRKITISIGIASFPECALEKKQLIVLADDALYKAKEKGRNRVEVAEAVNGAVLKEAVS
jgi:diguanylate cyclase (GGDEF)-like protein